MIKEKTQFVYDTKFHRRFKLIFDDISKIVISINKPVYKDTLYFYEKYELNEYPNKDVIWISNDNFVIELDDGIVDLTKYSNFLETFRTLKTYERITSYINYMKL